jgi:hypothetical protein
VIVLVCGSRTWTDADVIRRRLGQLRGYHGDIIVITGGAPGADTIAASVAYRLGLHVATMPALWHVHGKAAGPIRNGQMLRLRPDLVIAFTRGTRGAQDTIDRARAAGVPVEVHGWEADAAAACDHHQGLTNAAPQGPINEAIVTLDHAGRPDLGSAVKALWREKAT